MSETTPTVEGTKALDEAAIRELIDRALAEREAKNGYNKQNKIRSSTGTATSTGSGRR